MLSSSFYPIGCILFYKLKENLKKIQYTISYNNYHRKQLAKRKLIEKVLFNHQPPLTTDSETIFQKLQAKYNPLHKYGYDSFSAWSRATGRVQQMLKLIDTIRTPGLNVLEVGCGDGMTGASFAHFGHIVLLVDIEDWRDSRAKDIPFIQANLCSNLPFKYNFYDLIFSFNTFEHIKDPTSTLQELIRICKSKGYIFLEFGPLYWSPTGLHAYNLNMPYAQALFSIDFLYKKFKQIGIKDLGRELTELQPLNKWFVRQFDNLFQNCGCEIIHIEKLENKDFLSTILEFPQAFRGRRLTFEDVKVYAYRIILRKP